ncbi:MAG: hypothetical protein ACXWLM_02860 [Myxococcales bacterium]
MNRRLALLALALCALACGKQTFLAAAFVQTPQLPNPEDPANPIPQFQVITAYFGTIDTTDPTKIDPSKEAPITDATVTVAFHHTGTGGADVSEDRWLYDPNATGVPNKWSQSSGTYTLSSKDEPRLTFEVGVPYTLVLQPKGDADAYGARFIPGPPLDIAEFQGSTCSVTLPAPLSGSYSAPRCMDGSLSTPLTITRTDAQVGGQYLPAFVVVGRIDPQNPSAEPQLTFKTLPDSADKLLKFVLSDLPYRTKTFAIPATAFPSAGYYVVSLLSIKQGKVSGNAFPGSTALAGTGAAGIVRVQ